LLVGFLDRDGLSVGLSLAVIRVLTLNDDLDGVDVFAATLPGGKVWASAMRVRGIGFDFVECGLRLRRDKPDASVNHDKYIYGS